MFDDEKMLQETSEAEEIENENTLDDEDEVWEFEDDTEETKAEETVEEEKASEDSDSDKKDDEKQNPIKERISDFRMANFLRRIRW